MNLLPNAIALVCCLALPLRPAAAREAGPELRIQDVERPAAAGCTTAGSWGAKPGCFGHGIWTEADLDDRVDDRLITLDWLVDGCGVTEGRITLLGRRPQDVPKPAALPAMPHLPPVILWPNPGPYPLDHELLGAASFPSCSLCCDLDGPWSPLLILGEPIPSAPAPAVPTAPAPPAGGAVPTGPPAPTCPPAGGSPAPGNPAPPSRPTNEAAAIRREADDDLARFLEDPESARSLSPRRFELLIGEIFRLAGWEVEVTPESGDGGVDVIGRFQRFEVFAEAKRYGSTALGVATVRAFDHVLETRRATVGVLVTTGHVTRGARELVEERGSRLQLWDLDALAARARFVARHAPPTSAGSAPEALAEPA